MTNRKEVNCMTYAKLISGRLVVAPAYLDTEAGRVFNPDSETLLRAGYKPVRYTTMTVDPGIGCHWAPSWDETETEIVQVWKVEKIPEPPVDATDRLDEIFRILSGAE